MSTKFYYGFLIRNSNLFEIENLLRPIMSKSIKENAYNELTNSIIQDIDSLIVLDDDSKSLKQDKTLLSQLIVSRIPHDFNLNSKAEISIIGEYENNIICCAYNDYIYDLLLKNDNISDFSYWDNSDKPDHISKNEWTIRKEWINENIGYGPINNQGFTLTHHESLVSNLMSKIENKLLLENSEDNKQRRLIYLTQQKRIKAIDPSLDVSEKIDYIMNNILSDNTIDGTLSLPIITKELLNSNVREIKK